MHIAGHTGTQRRCINIPENAHESDDPGRARCSMLGASLPNSEHYVESSQKHMPWLEAAGAVTMSWPTNPIIPWDQVPLAKPRRRGYKLPQSVQGSTLSLKHSEGRAALLESFQFNACLILCSKQTAPKHGSKSLQAT